jgi:bifunctional non-homologous end joining protein LigD
MHRDVARCADSMSSFCQIRRRSDAGLTARRKSPHDEARRHALRLVHTLAESAPQHYILKAQASRPSGIFLDYARNWPRQHRDRFLLPARARRASDRSPVTWSRIEAGIRPDAFTMKSPFRARETTKPVRKRR